MIGYLITYPYISEDSDVKGWIVLSKQEAKKVIKNANTTKYPQIDKKLFKITPVILSKIIEKSLKQTNPEIFL